MKLMYLTITGPSIALVVGIVSKNMQETKKAYSRGAKKRILRYIEDTLEYGILFPMMTFLIISFMMQIRFEIKKQE